MEQPSKFNGTFRTIGIAILSSLIGAGGAIYASGRTQGQEMEKITQLELKVEKNYSEDRQDHDMILEVKGQLASLESSNQQIIELLRRRK